MELRGGHDARFISFDYEPIEALAALLQEAEDSGRLPLIGGAPQMLKIYPHGNDLPIVIRTANDAHFLLGRQMFDWEKTSYPVLDLSGGTPVFIYPLRSVPLPQQLRNEGIQGEDPTGLPLS